MYNRWTENKFPNSDRTWWTEHSFFSSKHHLKTWIRCTCICLEPCQSQQSLQPCLVPLWSANSSGLQCPCEGSGFAPSTCSPLQHPRHTSTGPSLWEEMAVPTSHNNCKLTPAVKLLGYMYKSVLWPMKFSF